MWVFTSIILILLGLGGVAFVTLLERKLLGLSQVRLGPNKVTFGGLLQPVMDGVKLLFKQLHMVSASQNVLFTMSPALLLVLFMVVWSWLLPWNGSMFFLKYSSLVFFSLLGVGAYMVILTGWSSASSFSKLGSLRGILQSLSFEVALILVFMVVLSFFSSFSFSYNVVLEVDVLILWLVLWLVLSLMETNRAPFDLLEGESELISGFNIEMSSLTFVFLFLSEYGMIIVLSMIMSLVLASSPTLLGMLYVVIILFLRSCYPRVRYDVMMSMMWEVILPLSVVIFLTFSVIKYSYYIDYGSTNVKLAVSLIKSSLSYVWELSTPKNITYLWGFGSFLGIVMVIQVASGFFLAFFYMSGDGAWESVVSLTREVSGGWIIRLVHGNTASFVFLVMYIHFFRAIIQSSFYTTYPWLSGWLIMVLTILAAFVGYVLPWGQMSFWGATVIINLLSVLPSGKTLVIWLWGGFYISSFTCSFFYAIHYIVPFVILVMAGVHLFLLHFSGSSLPGGLSRFNGLMIKFSFLFTYKDVVNLILLWLMFIWALVLPDWSADPVNFAISDPSNSPLHIQPEWYFLHLYAVLRSIPSKVGGLIGFALALTLLLVLGMVQANQTLSQFKLYSMIAWYFFSVNIVLLWLGMQPVEEPYVFMGQVATSLYFLYILLVLLMDFTNKNLF